MPKDLPDTFSASHICPECGRNKHRHRPVCYRCSAKNDGRFVANFIGVCQCPTGFEPDPNYRWQCRRCFKPRVEDLFVNGFKKDIDEIWPETNS